MTNRERLIEALGNGEYEVNLKSGTTDFLWLTGYRFENLVYSLRSAGGRIEEVLYVPPVDEMHERWYGRMLHPETVKDIEVRDISEFRGEITECGEIAKLRSVKQEYEIESLKKSIELTARGIEALRKVAVPGYFEYNLRAEFEKVIADAGYREPAFDTIVAAGANSLCMHYPECDKRIEEGDIILIDLGARVGTNGADISRTYPADERQKEIVKLSADCLDYVCQKAYPEITLKELNAIQDEYIGEELVPCRWHNITHHLGYDVHDTCGRDEPIHIGSTFTLEVGLYSKEWGWGVRTEDDILMTENGAVNLSKDIIPRF